MKKVQHVIECNGHHLLKYVRQGFDGFRGHVVDENIDLHQCDAQNYSHIEHHENLLMTGRANCPDTWQRASSYLCQHRQP
jgi:hypothetical protein